jgi:hypothetical protein
MRRRLVRAAIGLAAVVVLSGCTITASGYGSAPSSQGTGHPRVTITFSFRCVTLSGPTVTSGHFAYRDPANGVAVNGVTATGCSGSPGPTVFFGTYRSLTGAGSGQFTLTVGTGLCACTLRTGPLNATNNSFELQLSGGGLPTAYAGFYDYASALTGRVTINQYGPGSS